MFFNLKTSFSPKYLEVSNNLPMLCSVRMSSEGAKPCFRSIFSSWTVLTVILGHICQVPVPWQPVPVPWQPCPLAAIRKRPDGLFGLCETFARLPEPSVTLAKPSQVSQAEGDRYLDGLTCSYRSVDINYHTSSSSSIVPPCMPSEWLS